MMRPKCTKIMKGKLRIEVFRSYLDSVCEGEVLEEFTGERSCHQTWENGTIRNVGYKWWEHLGSELIGIRNLWLEEEDDREDYRDLEQYSSQEPIEDEVDEDIDLILSLMNMSLDGMATQQGTPSGNEDEVLDQGVVGLALGDRAPPPQQGMLRMMKKTSSSMKTW